MELKVVLTKDIETGWFVAEVPSLPGCISQGKTRASALRNIVDAAQGYLVSLKKHPSDRITERKVEIATSARTRNRFAA
ncbi:MAG: type II toxin-antitoxin system HicB family antitoxin [Candidatus Diapherotrites archaeon]|nr:type II toxin-antitoxin system HicB family antitoxin [Candidatus Diapherotrites archaeon]